MSRLVSSLPPVPSALRLISGLSDSAFAMLSSAIRSPQAFDTAGQRLTSLTAELQLRNPTDVYAIISSLEFLYAQIGADSKSRQELTNRFSDFIQESGLISLLPEDSDKVVQRVADLLYGNVAAELLYKRSWLAQGILPNFVSIRSFVDLRPNFSNDREEIQEFVISTILSLSIDKPADGDSSIAFQISEQGLKRIQECVADALKKIDLLQRQAFVSEKLAPTRE